ncbi:MAG TPA: M1 family aminopeptidase [Enhygromyxa sp.]|nr:M1 family aminopeptidase [Enhygromyxa sp.]
MEAFAPAGTPAQYAPDRTVDLEHADIAVFPDLVARRLTGVVEYRAKILDPEAREITLHGVDLRVIAASVDGQATTVRTADERIVIALPPEHGPTLTLRIEWQVEPALGLYFFGPETTDARAKALREGDEIPPRRGVPERRLALQAWTQGEMHETRHWLPSWDYPNDRYSSSWHIVAPEQLAVLANGEAQGHEPAAAATLPGSLGQAISEHPRELGELQVWHYQQAGDHVTYLLSFVIGRFEIVRDSWRGKPIEYWVPVGRSDEARATFGETPAMLDFFSDWIGVEYPWAKYAQSTVQEFTFGGMENVSATTMTDQILHPERLEPIADRQGLVAHELAHQWWGDLLTCREWAHVWLNEGFATYFTALWHEHSRGEDEFALARRGMAESYFGEARRYRRAIVTHEYRWAASMFDRHTYPKGGWVLHMLRRELGDEGFRQSLSRYAQDNAHALVETADLQRAIREQTGRNLDQFFAQWVYGPGHPVLGSRWRYDDASKTVSVTIEQRQDRVFEFAIDVELVGAAGVVARRVPIDRRSTQIVLAVEQAPQFVLVDAGMHLLAELDQTQTEAQWLAQLHGAARGIDRLRAAEALAGRSGPAVIEGLRKAVEGDSFHAVRTTAAESLGVIGDDPASRALLELWALERARPDSDPRLRRALLIGLAKARAPLGKAELALIEDVLEDDDNDFVRAAAATALARFDGNVPAHADKQARRQAEKLRDRAIKSLRKGLEQRSFHEEVEQACARALGQIGEAKQFALLLELLDARHPTPLRLAGVEALLHLRKREAVLGAEPRAESARAIVELLDDPNMRVRRAVIAIVGELELPDGEARLRRVIERDLDDRVRSAAEDQLRSL